MHSNQLVGQYGEKLVHNHLVSQNFEILATNYRCKIGEIDVVAKDGGDIVFIEVKTRRSHRYGGAIQAISAAKQRRLLRLARWWLSCHSQPYDGVRVELFAVQLFPDKTWSLGIVPVVG